MSETILALILLCGSFFALRDLMYGPRCLVCAVLAGLTATILFRLSGLLGAKSHYMLIGIYIVSIAGLLAMLSPVANGFLDSVNRLITLWNLRFDTEGRTFAVRGDVAFSSAVYWTFLAIPAAMLLLGLVHRKMLSAGMLVMIGALLFAFVIGRSSAWMSGFLIAAGIVGLLVFASLPKRIPSMRGLACILLAALLLPLVVWMTAGYDGSRAIADWRKDTIRWMEELRYGSDSLPRGDFRKASGLQGDGADTLELEMSTPQEMYLRGFVGADYRPDGWRELPRADYQGEFDGIMDWLETQQFAPVSQYASYYKIDQKASGRKEAYYTVQVSNKGAYRKYIYMPFSAESWIGGTPEQEKDWQIQSFSFSGARDYAFRAVKQAPSADTIVMTPWSADDAGDGAEQYLDAESVYHSFVETYYLDLEEELEPLIRETFFPEGNAEEMDFNDVTMQIRKVLRSVTKYQETPEKTPEGQDFLRWFLEDSHQGNAVQYATAAVMAYRAAGIPARYVEGYRYPEQDAASLTAAGENRVMLTSENAHAWAEVYVAGAGWMPVEVVPGMYKETYTDQIVEGKPSFQVNSRQDDEGLDVENGEGGAAAADEKEPPHPVSLGDWVPAGILLALYLCFLLFLLLELQRFLRIFFRGKMREGAPLQKRTQLCAGDLMRILRAGKVQGNYNHPMELADSVHQQFPDISAGEYERALNLIQKVQFGDSALHPYEEFALEGFLKRLGECLYRRGGILGKLKLRYWNAVPV